MTDSTTTAGKIASLRARLEESKAPMGPKSVQAIHDAGKSTARERVLALIDEGTFSETDALARHRSKEFELEKTTPLTDGVVTGYGAVNDQRVCVYSIDAQVFDGALGEVLAEKIVKIYDTAIKTGVPIIGIVESAGSRVPEGVVTLALQARLLARATTASGLVPQITMVAGPTHGVPAILTTMADLLVMVEDTATLHVATAEAITAVEGTKVEEKDLGDARAHATTTGTCHAVAADDIQAIEIVKEWLGFLPPNARATTPLQVVDTDDAAEAARAEELNDIVPDDDAVTYDVHQVIEAIVDGGEFSELQAGYADNIVTGFARVDGRAVGIVASQPQVLAGCLDIQASAKAARFIRTCDAFNLPIIEFVDSPGVAPSVGEELSGLTRRGAMLGFAYAEASVGKLTVITRKALGPSYVLLGSKDMGADLAYAWPTAEIAVADATSAARAIFGEDATNEQISSYQENYLTPYLAAERGMVDAVIEPSATRAQLIEGLRLTDRKLIAAPAKKHGNIQL